MPSDVTPAAPEARWEQATRALRRRIACGETSVCAPRRDALDARPFDEQVEHPFTKQNRDLIACSTPGKSHEPGARYHIIEFVELTDAGRGYLDSIP